MTLLAKLAPGVRLYDRRTGQERLVDKVEAVNQVVFLSFKHPSTGEIERQPFPLAELESRFELLTAEAVAFRARPEIVSLVAEAYRLRHAYLFNRLFATETSLIDLLPHQLAAVYGVPAGDPHGLDQPGMIDRPRLRFLLADDAGAGKTIMIGLVIRELLLRRLVRRVLVVSPAGLVKPFVLPRNTAVWTTKLTKGTKAAKGILFAAFALFRVIRGPNSCDDTVFLGQ